MNGHLRQRGKGSWELKFDLGRDPLTGKRITKYRSVKGTRKDAQKELRRLLSEADTGQFIDPAKITVADYMGRWLTHAGTTVSAKTLERYREIVDCHIVPRIGAVQLAKLKPLHVQTFYADLLREGRRDGKGGLSARTVHHIHRLLSNALRQAVKWEMLPRNPAAAVEAPTPEHREIEVLDDAQVATLLRTMKGTRHYTPTLVAATTGLRRGELLGLRWQDVDLKAGTLAVRQSLEQTKAGLRFKAPKTKRSARTITLPLVTVEALRAHWKEQAQERLMLGKDYHDSGLVFRQVDGHAIVPERFSKSFAHFVRQADIPPVSLHAIRHTHLSQLLRSGVHPKVASERAGHASVAITLDIYSHVIPGLQEDAATRVDAAMRAALED